MNAPIPYEIADYIYKHRTTPTKLLCAKFGVSETTVKRYKRGHKPMDKYIRDRRAEIEAYLTEHYADQTDREIGEALHCKSTTAKQYAQRMGLTKSAAYYERIKAKRRQNVLKASHSPNRSENRRKLWRMERRRVELGLPRKTKLCLGTISQRKTKMFSYLRTVYGYICSKEELFTVYYDEQTKRNKHTENYYTTRFSLEFKPYEQKEKDIPSRADAEALQPADGAMGNS